MLYLLSTLYSDQGIFGGTFEIILAYLVIMSRHNTLIVLV